MARYSTTFLIIALLFFSSTFIYAARPLPASHNQKAEIKESMKMDDVESCGEVNEEECLMRRTLVAHTDYIYTNQQNP
ncbi:unnamed protein product [Amaranthus hypochondriacus]